MRLRRQIVEVGERLRIGVADAQDFRSVLTLLPGNYAKSKEWRGLAPREIAPQCAGWPIKPIAFATCNRHFSVMTAEWAVCNELIEQRDNPFNGLWLEIDFDLDPMFGGSATRKVRKKLNFARYLNHLSSRVRVRGSTPSTRNSRHP